MLAYKKILVPVDFAEISKSAIVKAARHSEASNSELLLAHIVDVTSASCSDPTQLGDKVEFERANVERAEMQMDRLLDSLEIGYCDKYVETGEPLAALLQLINDRGIDLVVMGTRNLKASPSWVRSMTVEVVSKTDCDVLVLHK